MVSHGDSTAKPTEPQNLANATHQQVEIPREDEGSPGARRMWLLTTQIQTGHRALFVAFLVILALGHSLNESFHEAPIHNHRHEDHRKTEKIAVSTIWNGILGVISHPVAAKLSDVFGRPCILMAALLLVGIGSTIIYSTSTVEALVAGGMVYNAGRHAVWLMIETILGDMTAIRERIFFLSIPQINDIYSQWISDLLCKKLHPAVFGWLPLIFGMPFFILFFVTKKRLSPQLIAKYEAYRSAHKATGRMLLLPHLFWRLDVPGLVLLTIALGLALYPLAISGPVLESTGGDQGSFSNMISETKDMKVTPKSMEKTIFIDPTNLVPFVFGLLCLPAFVLWEIKATHPVLPYKLLYHRSVWGSIGLLFTFYFLVELQMSYLHTILVVAFDREQSTADQVMSLNKVSSAISSIYIGYVAYGTDYYKSFLVAGTLLSFPILGIAFKWPGGNLPLNLLAMYTVQITLGYIEGQFQAPTLAILQGVAGCNETAAVTGLFYTVKQFAVLFARTIAAIIWRSITFSNLLKKNGYQMAYSAVFEPMALIRSFTWGSDGREDMVKAYARGSRVITLVGLCLCVLMLFFALSVWTFNPSHEEEEAKAEEAAARRSSRHETPSGLEDIPTPSRGAYLRDYEGVSYVQQRRRPVPDPYAIED